jgi:hypothetical protein
MAIVRQSTLSLFKSFQRATKTGTASNSAVSVRAIGFILIGHQKTPPKDFQERYL